MRKAWTLLWRARRPGGRRWLARAGVALAVTLGGLAMALPMDVAASGWTVSLGASDTAPGVGTTVTLTARANADVGTSPTLWIQIYDLSTGNQVCASASGTTCATDVSNTLPTCRSYQAYVADWSSTLPPSNVQATSNAVTVCWGAPVPPWSVTLYGQPTTAVAGAPAELVATTSRDVGPTVYYTQIFDLNDNHQVVSCASGMVCTMSVTQSVRGCHGYIAEVAPNSLTYPAPGAIAESDTVFICWQ